MLENLQTEIDNHPEFLGASNKIIIETLNTNGSAEIESWVTDEKERLVPKGDMLALLSLSSQVKFYDWMNAESDAAKGFSLFYNAHEHFKCNDPVFIGTMQLLYNPLAIITETELNLILRLGQRKISRAEELFGRKITIEDF